MDDLFRFILARPAQHASDDDSKVQTRPSKELHNALRDAKASSSAAARRVAAAYADSARALQSVKDLKYGAALQRLLEVLDGSVDRSQAELVKLIKQFFDVSPNDVVTNADFVSDRERLSDVLVVNAILGRDRAVTSYDAARFLRVAVVIERVAIADGSLVVKGGIARALRQPIVLPSDIFPLARAIGAPPVVPVPPPQHDPAGRLAALRTERDRLLSTYNVLTRLTPDHIVSPGTNAVGDRTTAIESSARASLPPIVRTDATDSMAADETRATSGINPGLVSRTAGFTLMLKPTVIAALGERERTVLEERHIDLTQVSVPTAVERLSVELGEVEFELTALEARTHHSILKVGNSYVDAEVAAIGDVGRAAQALLPSAVPTTHGNVVPVGIGDLLVVKQALKRYEARELAHVENVLAGEFKERTHLRSRTTEETVTVETEVKREEERDQQTTERFELKTEASQLQKEDMSLKIGLAVSGKYGPVVEFKASTDFALNTSKEEASKIATSYSKDVTTRAATRIFERRREERILKTIEVFKEKNTHGIDNKTSANHVVGQYQWIDKIYEAQVYNYGARLLFDIMVPEPAAFLLHALTQQPKASADLVKPLPFTLSPTDLTEWNYAYYVKQYQVVGVTPPPEPYLTVAKVVEGKGTQADGVTKVLEIPLPDGYGAIGHQWASRYNEWNGKLDVVVLPDPVSLRVGSITLAVKGWKIEVFTVSLAIFCQRTERVLTEWKLKTHVAILQGYQKQLRDYEEKLAALEVQAAQQIQGRNPGENEQLIRAELKKGATSVFTAQHFDLFGAISLSSQGYPQANLTEAEMEGKYIRFFEQALEWDQMMYFFYPYFWGRKSNWLKRALLQDADPLFAEFTKAGAARVVLSVRPGFESAFAHYLDTGQIWEGGDLPDVTSPLYVSIIEEIRERDKAPGSEVAQGDPWDVHLPTTLVILRDKSGLPEWQKNAAGDWEPV